MAILMADANFDLYSTFWNSDTNTIYTTPAALNINQHGINGSAAADFWYDFAWD